MLLCPAGEDERDPIKLERPSLHSSSHSLLWVWLRGRTGGLADTPQEITPLPGVLGATCCGGANIHMSKAVIIWPLGVMCSRPVDGSPLTVNLTCTTLKASQTRSKVIPHFLTKKISTLLHCTVFIVQPYRTIESTKFLFFSLRDSQVSNLGKLVFICHYSVVVLHIGLFEDLGLTSQAFLLGLVSVWDWPNLGFLIQTVKTQLRYNDIRKVLVLLWSGLVSVLSSLDNFVVSVGAVWTTTPRHNFRQVSAHPASGFHAPATTRLLFK